MDYQRSLFQENKKISTILSPIPSLSYSVSVVCVKKKCQGRKRKQIFEEQVQGKSNLCSSLTSTLNRIVNQISDEDCVAKEKENHAKRKCSLPKSLNIELGGRRQSCLIIKAAQKIRSATSNPYRRSMTKSSNR